MRYNDMLRNGERIKKTQWDSYAKRIETKNLKEHGQSKSFCTILMHCNKSIICVESDTPYMIVKKNWREEMKKYLNT